jgi:glycosyltransferase involved in cell wall biosynthesis
MHVLQVTPYFPPTWAYGGIPRIVDGLSRALVRQGVQVTVLTTDALDAGRRVDLPRRRDHHGVQVLTVPNLSNRAAYQHQLFLPLGGGRTLRGVADVDIVHLHGHRHLLNNVAVAWARRRGLPYVLTANGTLLRHERKVGVKLLWDLAVAGHVPRSAARCVAVSAADVAQHHRAGLSAERIVRIPNGLDLGEFEALPPRGAFRAAHGLGDRPLVAYLGQVSPRKGVDHLVAAFADGALGEAVLVIGGNDMGGMAAARARGPAPQAARFVGLLEGPERLALLADADVLVYPSTDEVFGLVPFEGLLCGAPVVVGEDCGCGELIAEAGAGLLVRHGDVDGLRARIRTLLADRVAAGAMVARGRRYVAEHLGFERVAAQHAALYARILDERRRA